MIYQFECDKCQTDHEINKSMKDSGSVEKCPSCGNILTRVYSYTYFIGAKVESPEYNAGLGCVTKSAKHRAEIAKSRGLIEVGNERPDSLKKQADKTMAEKLSWENV
jgi:putative FmdB family regulatory protein